MARGRLCLMTTTRATGLTLHHDRRVDKSTPLSRVANSTQVSANGRDWHAPTERDDGGEPDCADVASKKDRVPATSPVLAEKAIQCPALPRTASRPRGRTMTSAPATLTSSRADGLFGQHRCGAALCRCCARAAIGCADSSSAGTGRAVRVSGRDRRRRISRGRGQIRRARGASGAPRMPACASSGSCGNVASSARA